MIGKIDSFKKIVLLDPGETKKEVWFLLKYQVALAQRWLDFMQISCLPSCLPNIRTAPMSTNLPYYLSITSFESGFPFNKKVSVNYCGNFYW